MDWSTACPDWERRVVAGESLIPFEPLYPGEAAASLEIFRGLRLADVAGVPTMGEVCRQWIIDFVSHVFGAYDVETGRRVITEFFMLISKKNAKSTTAAGIMLTALVRNWRESAEFLILAPTIEIANNSFFPARDMVRKDAELSDLLHVQDHYRTITHRNNGAMLKIVAADNETVSGKKATGVLVDELWLFGKRPNAENMLREATGGLASRPEGFTIFLSTQSDEAPAGVFAQKLEYARGVRDGRIIDKQFLPVLYEFPEAMIKDGKHRNAKHFYVTNPNLGASVSADFLERELQKSQNAGEGSMRGFLAKHVNVQIDLALGVGSWAGAEVWATHEVAGEVVEHIDRALDLVALLERSEVVCAGIDGGGLDDLLGAYVLGRERGTQRWLGWGHAWAHKIVLERRKEIATQLEQFAKDGDLTIVDTPGQDTDAVVELVKMLVERGLLASVGVDVHGIGAIYSGLVGTELEPGPVAKDRVIGIPQGWRLVGAIKTAERKLAAGQLVHGGARMMAWCASNARVVPAGNAVLITKQASGTAKIDPLMAMFNAVSLLALNPDRPGSKEPQLLFLGAAA